jgi:lysophospholipase L1-like esterase
MVALTARIHDGCMTKSSMRVRVGIVVIGLVTVVGWGSGGAANASRTDVVEGRYLALGDSVPFGYSPLLEDPWIPQRFVGYPEIIEQQTGLTTTNVSCPGQTAQALVSRTALDNGCFDAHDWFHDAGLPFLHVEYSGTQLDAALAAVRSATPPSLISIQAGSNEMIKCLFDLPDFYADPDQCLNEEFPHVTESLRHVATQLRAAGYGGPIVIVGYHLYPGVELQMARLNRFIARAAHLPHVAFAKTAGLFERYARRHHGDLCSTGLLIALPDGSCDLHPSPLGNRLVANAVLEAAYPGRGRV